MNHLLVNISSTQFIVSTTNVTSS